MPTLSPFIGTRLDSFHRFHRFHLFRHLVSAGYLKNHLEWRSKKNRICEPPASIMSSRGDSSQAAMGVLRSLSTRNKPWNCQRRRHSPTEKTRIFFPFGFRAAESVRNCYLPLSAPLLGLSSQHFLFFFREMLLVVVVVVVWSAAKTDRSWPLWRYFFISFNITKVTCCLVEKIQWKKRFMSF